MTDNNDKGKKKVFSLFVVGLLIVEEKNRVVVERFGKYLRTLKSGLRCIFFPGIVDRIKDEIFIEQETIPLFLEPIKIDFKDGSATPKNAIAYIEIDRPDTGYLTKEEEKLTDGEREKKGIEKRTGVFRATYHIRNRKEAIRDRLENAIRSYLNGLTIQEGIEMARGGYDLLGPNGISEDETDRLKGVFEDWGIILHAITIGDFDLELDLVRARGELHKRLKEKEAAVFLSEKRAIESGETVIEMMARTRGKKVDEIRQIINADEKLQERFLNEAVDFVKRQMGYDAKSRVDINVEGVDGLGKDVLSWLAAWLRMPMGEKGKEDKPLEPPEEPSEKEEKEEKKELSDKAKKAYAVFRAKTMENIHSSPRYKQQKMKRRKEGRKK